MEEQSNELSNGPKELCGQGAGVSSTWMSTLLKVWTGVQVGMKVRSKEPVSSVDKRREQGGQ